MDRHRQHAVGLRRRHRRGDGRGLHRRPDAAVAQLLLSTLAAVYVEFVRNIPLLFFVLFWYFGVLSALPTPKESYDFLGIAFLNRRGLSIPNAQRRRGLPPCPARDPDPDRRADRARPLGQGPPGADRPGFPDRLVGFVLCGLLPVAALVGAGAATSWDVPTLRGFNYRGGFVLVPEFVALFMALSTYTAGFIAEVVRGGVQSVRQGQIDAARALGLTPGRVVRLVVIPQAMPVIIPPITGQYLNLIKNSSFGAAIAYPEIVAVFMARPWSPPARRSRSSPSRSASISPSGLAVSAFMNCYNARHSRGESMRVTR